jgi:UDP-N-acetylmuramoyl-L-alanyl-D-glutamate--2,6-diaminopimelate ligase
MTFAQLSQHFLNPELRGSLDGVVTAVTSDSRKVVPGTVFFALKGVEADGHDFIPQAIAAGATAIVAEVGMPPMHSGGWAQVADARLAYGSAAAALAGFPALGLQVAGVTGTNGKSTIALLLRYLLGGMRVGMLGTIRYEVGGDGPVPASRTTPEAGELQSLFQQMRDNGCKACTMEVSSHALHQHRVAGVEFDAAIFTNLTQDHLDYHGTMENYYQAKASFAKLLLEQKTKTKPVLVTNYDDPYGKRLYGEYKNKLKVVSYGSGFGSDYRFTDVAMTIQGTQFTLEYQGRQMFVKTPLLGRFNIYNVLAAVAAAHGMGYNLRETLTLLPNLPQVPGRMESVGKQKGFRVLVDYAHTPDALENALKTIKGLGPRRIITVFGCGGSRDRAKRPLMGNIAEQYSDVVLTTSDNPRKEDPQQILADIARGITGRVPHRAIESREEAIETAIAAARDGDVILIAGKGHEKKQVFADHEVDFDDCKVAAKYLKSKAQARLDDLFNR